MDTPLFRYVFWISCLCMIACGEKESPKPPCDGSLTLAVSAMSPSPCGENIGSLTLSASGGTGAYEFQLSGGAFQSSNRFTDLTSGMYTLKVQDENDCTAQVEGQVTSGLDLESIRPLLETYCSVSGCHDGTDGLTDYRVDSVVIARASVIKGRTETGNMPPSNSGLAMTQAEIDRVVCWVDDGAPQ